MFTILTTWISERIITVTAVSVLTVAAVPTTLIIVSNHDDHNTVAVIKSDQARFAKLKFMTPQDEENELAEFDSIAIIALGDGHSTGTITVTCQTVLITITETIQITVIQTTPAPCKTEADAD